MASDSITHQVKYAISDILLEVVARPFSHFSEKSLQLRLAARLLTVPEIATPRPTSIGTRYGRRLESIRKEENRSIDIYHQEAFKTTPLQMEYGSNLKGPFRIDLAILDPEEIHSIVTPQLQNSEKQYLRPLVGIEFGTEKSNWRNMSGQHLDNDGEKVRQCVPGYVINVMRNTNFGRRSGRRYRDNVSKSKPSKMRFERKWIVLEVTSPGSG